MLRSQIYLSRTYDTFEIQSARLHASEMLLEFYDRRGFNMAWLEKGVLSPAGEGLIDLLQNSKREGLHPPDYHIHSIETIWDNINQQRESTDGDLYIEMELLLTDAFFIYASDLLAGRMDPDSMERVFVQKTPMDLIEYLEEVLSHETPKDLLKSLGPPFKGYSDLRTALAHYTEIQDKGGFTQLPPVGDLKEGDKSPQVALLRERLKEEPFLEVDLVATDQELFDNQLKEALSLLQAQRNLEVTGYLNNQTRRYLNNSAQEMIDGILINLERWRWLPPFLEERYILVNIPGFYLEFIENQERVMDMRVIVGHLGQKTPSLQSRISHLVFSPRWYIPTSLAKRKYLPMVREEPEELEEMKIRVYELTSDGYIEIDHRDVDWENVDTDNFNYYFWQDAGPWNRLGRVIFMFPNPYHVYLHDTPDKYLFDRSVRTFSEGCIRIGKPIELALYLLRDQGWSEERVQEVIERRREETVFLNPSVPVYLEYFTLWIDEGRLEVIDDIYRKDQKLLDSFMASW